MFLSKPKKATDSRKDTSLLWNMSIYRKLLVSKFYSTGLWIKIDIKHIIWTIVMLDKVLTTVIQNEHPGTGKAEAQGQQDGSKNLGGNQSFYRKFLYQKSLSLYSL